MILVTIVVLLLLVGAVICIVRRPLNPVTYNIAQLVVLELVPAFIYYTLYPSEVKAPSVVMIVCAVYLAYWGSFTLGYIGITKKLSIETKFFSWFEHRTVLMKRTFALSVFLIFAGVGSLVWLEQSTGQQAFTRAIYENTRSGYGPLFFGGQSVAMLALVLASCYFRGTAKMIISVLCLICLGGFGAKGPLMAGIGAVLMLQYGRVPFSVDGVFRVFGVATAALIALYCAFWLYSPWARENLLSFYSAYSDQFNNYMTEVATWTDFRYGVLSLQDNFYAFIPRSLFPNKPDVFGAIELSEWYFSFERLKAGAPSFGRFGRIWADFGLVSLVFLPAMALIKGRVARLAEECIFNRRELATATIYLCSLNISYFVPGQFSITVQVINFCFGIIVWRCITRAVQSSDRVEN